MRTIAENIHQLQINLNAINEVEKKYDLNIKAKPS